jgi:hypothetical protein
MTMSGEKLKKLGLIAALGAAVIAVAQPAIAQDHMGKTIWTNLNFGMSPAEVLALQPTATKPKKPRILGDETCSIVIEDYRVLSFGFHVCFYFAKEKLNRVWLERKTSTNEDFTNIRNQLRTKYGQEVEAKEGGSPLDNQMARWHPETNTVTLLLIKSMLDPRFGTIMWVYREPSAPENDKL